MGPVPKKLARLKKKTLNEMLFFSQDRKGGVMLKAQTKKKMPTTLRRDTLYLRRKLWGSRNEMRQVAAENAGFKRWEATEKGR